MSAEHLSSQPEALAPDEFAIRQFQAEKAYYDTTSDFVQSIQFKYETVSDGRLEINHMVRAARFLLQDTTGSPGREVRAIVEGQLVASQLLNYLHTDRAPVSGLTHSFIQSELHKSQASSQEVIRNEGKSIYDPKHGHTINLIAETNESQRNRISRLAYQVQHDLSLRQTEPILSNTFEEFGLSIASELHDDENLATLSLVGFRLVLRQYERSVASVQTVHFDEDPAGKSHLPQLSRESFLSSDESLAELTGITNEQGSVDVLVPIENISHVRKNFLHKFQLLLNEFTDEELQDDATLFTIMEYCKSELKRFNTDFELLFKDDFLLISGEFYASAISHGEVARVPFQKHIEIRGVFDGFSVLEVPSQKEFISVIKKGKEIDDNTFKSRVLSPTINLKDAVILKYKDQINPPDVDYTTDITLEIPLTYHDIHIQRVKNTP